MKVLIDMNLSPRWVDVLHSEGIDAVHWSLLGPTNAPDEQIMSSAVASGYVILTNDLDFGIALAATKAPFPSIVQIRSQDLSPDSLGQAVVSALRLAESDLDRGALLTFDPKKTRLSTLPLA